MPKPYLSGAAKQKTRQERATNAAKIPKISAFLKPEDSAQESPVDIVTLTESMSDMTSSVAAAVTLDTGKHDITSENTETPQ